MAPGPEAQARAVIDALLLAAGLRGCQIDAITGLEASLADDRPHALVQMATGADKTCIVQHLHGHRIDPDAKLIITTIQRLYAMLRGEDLDEADEPTAACANAPTPQPKNWPGATKSCCAR